MFISWMSDCKFVSLYILNIRCVWYRLIVSLWSWPENLTPQAFEKHCGRPGARNWKKHIWVMINDKKVPLSKTVLITYYKLSTNTFKYRKTFHRDEFITCSECKKERRFLLRSYDGCRMYHDALAIKMWKCSDWPYDK
jgi:hypothetical protein